ncbi:MAG: hypothetical protein ACJAWL_001113 [Motiliproteus sp.]|jgi:hypothetical protein
MNRRNFIQVFGLGLGSIALSSTIVGCGTAEPTLSIGWEGPEPAEKDIRMQVLAYAITCPNPTINNPG